MMSLLLTNLTTKEEEEEITISTTVGFINRNFFLHCAFHNVNREIFQTSGKRKI